MGPRSHERGNRSSRSRAVEGGWKLLLQWGRVLTNAETCSISSLVSWSSGRILMLQWGRVLTNAETAASRRTRPRSRSRPRTLQWGRVLTERGNRASLPPQTSDAATALKLQWGRVLTNAETWRDCPSPGNDVDTALASMGPRSHERGNWAIPACERVDDKHLASMGPRSHERGNPIGIRVRTAQRFIMVSASMGPRSHERGNDTGQASIGNVNRHIALLQWGRVLTNAENMAQHAGDAVRLDRHRFNGAAFSRTRKLTLIRHLATRERNVGFNGAAFSRTRKPALRRSGSES